MPSIRDAIVLSNPELVRAVEFELAVAQEKKQVRDSLRRKPSK